MSGVRILHGSLQHLHLLGSPFQTTPIESDLDSFAVAEVLEAMLSGRPHRPTPGVEAAMSEIATGKGTLCDADAVGACIRLFGESKFEFGKVGTHLPPKSDSSEV